MGFHSSLIIIVATLLSSPAFALGIRQIDPFPNTSSSGYSYDDYIFKELIDQIRLEENWDTRFAFEITSDGDQAVVLARVDMFYTGGDWMNYGFTYFFTDAPQMDIIEGVPTILTHPRAYFMDALSTRDQEGGSTPPAIDPFDEMSLKSFILKQFLDESGNVNDRFSPSSNPAT